MDTPYYILAIRKSEDHFKRYSFYEGREGGFSATYGGQFLPQCKPQFLKLKNNSDFSIQSAIAELNKEL